MGKKRGLSDSKEKERNLTQKLDLYVIKEEPELLSAADISLIK